MKSSLRRNRHIGWIVTIILCTIPLILWLAMGGIADRFGSFYGTMSSLGKITGLVGLAMYALNLVYSTRLRFLEDWFGGLNRVYIAHHILGGLALILLTLHPIFLALRYVMTSLYDAALILLPHGLTPLNALFNVYNDNHPSVLEQWAIFAGIIAFLGMVVLLVFTFFIRLPYWLWIFTHRFLGWAFFIAGLHVLFITSDTSVNMPLKVYILALTVIGLAAFIYRSLLGRILVRRYQYQVVDVTVVGRNITKLILKPIKRPLSYSAGQFVFIRFLFTGTKGVTSEWHPFSISSAPTDNYLRLSVKALGDYTSALTGLAPGAVAEIEGAYGKFGYNNLANANQIWIAGGIGITPFISMAYSLPPSMYRIDLYYAVKTPSELVEWQNLLNVSNFHQGNFRLIPFVSEQQGMLTADYIEGVSGLADKDVLICGPPPMMKSLRKQLRKKGVPNRRIHSEEFSMS